MYENDFFVVDMSSCTSTGEIINNVSLALETLDNGGKKIVLKLNDGYLNQSQLLSIQSLITSYGCTLDTIETINEKTASVAENMNIYVQEPLERRIQDKYPENNNQNVVSSDKYDPSIALKDVTGLHFEADLDAIKKQQDEINIQADLKKAGISPFQDFDKIEEQISSKYSTPGVTPLSLEDMLKTPSLSSSYMEQPLESIKNDYNEESQIDVARAENIMNDIIKNEFPQAETTQAETFEKQEIPTIEVPEIKPVSTLERELENVSKNSIGVYKKAYDENPVDENEWEGVDFYESPTNEPVISDTKSTVYINQTLRSGQVLNSDGNVVIIGDCHPGSEIHAVGDVTVWGVLSGIVHAGCRGNINAKVRALKINAVQLRIGNCYSRRPDGTNIPYVIKTSIFTPEEARVVNDEIVLFKINQN